MKHYNAPSQSFTEAFMNYVCIRMQFRSTVLHDTLSDEDNRELTNNTLCSQHNTSCVKH